MQEEIHLKSTPYFHAVELRFAAMIGLNAQFQGANMADIQVLKINNKDYISLQDAARYLGCDEKQLTDYVYLDKLRVKQIESRWLLEWDSVEAFAEKRGQKRRVG